MAEGIMIAGHQFNVTDRYEEGHELTANEASALNQVRRENLRNNFARKVEDAKNGAERVEDENILAELQGQLDAYANEYEFGVRTGGGFVRDPVLSEAMKIAREKIFEALKVKGIKRKNVEASAITTKAKWLVENKPEIMELAKQRVADMKAAIGSELDDVLADVA